MPRIAALPALLLFVHLSAAGAAAQALEVGGVASYLDLEALDEAGWGLGGRLGYDTGVLVTVEGELTAFGDHPRGGRRLQALGGVKLGGRTRAYGLFGKLRPGIVRFGRDFILPGTGCIAVFPTPEACLARRTSVALDFGSAIELYPAARLIARVDIGTTYVWYRARGDARTERTGNFQLSLGGGYRF